MPSSAQKSITPCSFCLLDTADLKIRIIQALYHVVSVTDYAFKQSAIYRVSSTVIRISFSLKLAEPVIVSQDQYSQPRFPFLAATPVPNQVWASNSVPNCCNTSPNVTRHQSFPMKASDTVHDYYPHLSWCHQTQCKLEALFLITSNTTPCVTRPV